VDRVYPQTAGNAIEKWVGSLTCSEDFALTYCNQRPLHPRIQAAQDYVWRKSYALAVPTVKYGPNHPLAVNLEKLPLKTKKDKERYVVGTELPHRGRCKHYRKSKKSFALHPSINRTNSVQVPDGFGFLVAQRSAPIATALWRLTH
jgi:hypothetical protein